MPSSSKLLHFCLKFACVCVYTKQKQAIIFTRGSTKKRAVWTLDTNVKMSFGSKFVLAPFLQLICFICTLVVVASHDGEGRAALLEIKRSFRDVHNMLEDWTQNPSSHHCRWRGVTCDNATFDVVALNISGFSVGGEVSRAVGDLKSLQTLDMCGNGLSGEIPDEIGGCSSLRYLELSFNQLHGDIPSSISNLTYLEYLSLKNNQLVGPIPLTLSQVPNLQVLDLGFNKLTGEIPRLIYRNKALLHLGLEGNELVGTLPPDICQLTALQYFYVKNNSLTGNIPQNIGSCTTFQVLDLSYNQLSGELPFSIVCLNVATLSLQGNLFSGEIPPEIGLMQALITLDLSRNMLSGPIPPLFGNLKYTDKLYLNGNRLNGSIPPELGNMTNLHYLELNDNFLTGLIPPELGNLTNLFHLNVANNNIEGPIPDNLSSCKNLNHLNVHGNKLSGTIPPGFQGLESMTYLNCSSNNIRSFNPIELSRIGNLDTLDISDNGIRGSIPSSLGDLEHLLKLNLSKNNLTGTIPAEFGNLISVIEIDLSNNNISGMIPQEFSQLQNIHLLRLENNHLSGDVTLLNNCPSLIVLNVSYNNLTGSVPTSNSLSRFPPDSFLGNPGLCGYYLGPSCHEWNKAKSVASSKQAILGTVAVTTLAILLMILVAACQQKNPKRFCKISLDKPAKNGRPKLVILHMNLALHVYEDIVRITENFSEKYIIGYGASSTVYRCVLKNCRPVAIKRLNSNYLHCLEEFETELNTIGSVRHWNLVSLQGYCLSPAGHLLFYDYMENGSLWDILHGPTKKKKLYWDCRLHIALGAAQGLSYLHHECSPRVVHRDVKPSNILLDKDLKAHLTDFGIAKCLCTSQSYTSTHVLGTIGYIDPDYARTARLTEKSDVYSYGVVLLELLTGRKAVDNGLNLHHLILSETANDTVMEIVDPEIIDTCKDLGAVKMVFQLALLCTNKLPQDRPTMHEVTQVLSSLMPDEPTPKRPSAMLLMPKVP